VEEALDLKKASEKRRRKDREEVGKVRKGCGEGLDEEESEKKKRKRMW
jgi:hypothetical protein